MPDPIARLHVCVTCRAGRPPAAADTPPGALLHAALVRLVRDGSCEIRDVACLASCARGCAAAISMPGKWSYLLGKLSVAHAPDLLAYAAAYSASASGTVLPSRRPASLRDVILGRFPAADAA